MVQLDPQFPLLFFENRLYVKMPSPLAPPSTLGIGHLLTGKNHRKPQSRFDLREKLLIEPIHDGFVPDTPFVSIEHDQNGLAQSTLILAQQNGTPPFPRKVWQALAQVEIELS